MTTQQRLYLIWSNGHRMWWRANWGGYTAVIEEAGRYPLDEALDIIERTSMRGALMKRRTDEVTGREYVWAPEVAVPAPVGPPGSED